MQFALDALARDCNSVRQIRLWRETDGRTAAAYWMAAHCDISEPEVTRDPATLVGVTDRRVGSDEAFLHEPHLPCGQRACVVGQGHRTAGSSTPRFMSAASGKVVMGRTGPIGSPVSRRTLEDDPTNLSRQAERVLVPKHLPSIMNVLVSNAPHVFRNVVIADGRHGHPV
jgi:hypothetical protein